MNIRKLPRFGKSGLLCLVGWNPAKDPRLHCHALLSCWSFSSRSLPLLTSFLKVYPSQGLVLKAAREESRQAGWYPEDVCLRRIKAAVLLLGALVCQISLLESMCQGLGGISGQAPDPRVKLLTLQGYLWQLLAWAAQRDAACFLVLSHGEPTVLTPGALPWSPWLL